MCSLFSWLLLPLLLFAVNIVDIVTIAPFVPSLASIAIRVVIVTACAGLAARPAAPPPCRSGGGPRGSRLQAPTGSPPHDAFTTLAYFRGLLVVLAAAAGKGGLTS